ncbi:hypothetical protein BH11VER1_BH11VER1_02580 [soil metagenome]
MAEEQAAKKIAQERVMPLCIKKNINPTAPRIVSAHYLERATDV